MLNDITHTHEHEHKHTYTTKCKRCCPRPANRTEPNRGDFVGRRWSPASGKHFSPNGTPNEHTHTQMNETFLSQQRRQTHNGSLIISNSTSQGGVCFYYTVSLLLLLLLLSCLVWPDLSYCGLAWPGLVVCVLLVLVYRAGPPPSSSTFCISARHTGMRSCAGRPRWPACNRRPAPRP